MGQNWSIEILTESAIIPEIPYKKKIKAFIRHFDNFCLLKNISEVFFLVKTNNMK